jgi:hypothetical protein
MFKIALIKADQRHVNKAILRQRIAQSNRVPDAGGIALALFSNSQGAPLRRHPWVLAAF